MQRLAHIGLAVLDLPAMLDFYVGKLGLTLARQTPHPRGGTIVFLNAGDTEIIEMIQHDERRPGTGRDRARTGLHHFGLLVDDIVAEQKRLELLGVEFDGGIKGNTAGEQVVHFWDPEGNRLHLTQIRH